MRIPRKAALSAALFLLAFAGAFACASKDRKAARAVRPDDAPAQTAGDETPPAVVDEEPPAPPDPFEGITGDPSVGFAGEEQLLLDDRATELTVPAFDVACVRGEDLLRAPASVDARFESVASEQSVPLGRVRFVRIERRDASVARLCRPVRHDARLYAPLFREQEPASTWLVEYDAGDVRAAVRRLVERAASKKATAAGPPRAIVVRGEVVAVALPIAG